MRGTVTVIGVVAPDSVDEVGKGLGCYVSRQTYIEVKDTYSEGGTHEETLHPQSKARVMNKRRGD